MGIAARTRRGSLELATDTWRNAAGRTVTLIGMAHAADPDFYSGVLAQIDHLERAGAEVHYELIGKPHTDVKPIEQELDWARRLKAADSISLFAGLAGLSTQRAIEMQPHWHNTDLDMITLLRRLDDPERMISSTEKMMEKMSTLDPEVASRIIGWALRHVPLLSRYTTVRCWFNEDARRDRKVILDDRNRIAVEAAMIADGDVVALWGAGHLPGIGDELKKWGFQRIDRRWDVAMRKPVTEPAPAASEAPKA